MNPASEETNGPIEFSSTIGALAKALAAAQSEIGDAKKDAVNPHFKNRYATLASVREAVTPALSKNGLAVTQLFEPSGPDGVMVVTLLVHSSGEWIRSKLYLPVSKKDAQGFGSAISYGRRYQLAAIAGIASDEDDDAEAAVKPSTNGEPKPGPVKTKAQMGAPAAEKINVDELVNYLTSARNTKELSEASAKVGRVKDKLAKGDFERCRSAHDETMRRLEAEARPS